MRNQYKTLFEVYSENVHSVAPSSILDKVDVDVAHIKARKVTDPWSSEFIKYKDYYKEYLINKAKKEGFFDNQSRIDVDSMWKEYSELTEERMREELIDNLGDEAVDYVIEQDELDEEVDENFYQDFKRNYLPKIKAEYEKKYNDIMGKPSKELGIDIDIEESKEKPSASKIMADAPPPLKIIKNVSINPKKTYYLFQQHKDTDKDSYRWYFVTWQYGTDINSALEQLERKRDFLYKSDTLNVVPLVEDCNDVFLFVYSNSKKADSINSPSLYISKEVINKVYAVPNDPRTLDSNLVKCIAEINKTTNDKTGMVALQGFKRKVEKALQTELKTKSILKKGSEEAGIEIDIEEAYQHVKSESRDPSDSPALVKGLRSKVVSLCDSILGIKDARVVNDIIRYLEEVVGPSLSYDGYADGVMQKYVSRYINKNLNSGRKVDQHLLDNMNLVYGYWSPKIKKAIADSFKQMYKEYNAWKKTQEVLKKGSEEAGMEIDIEESNNDFDYEWETLITSYPDSNIFIEWLYKHLIEEGSIDVDNDLECDIKPGFESIQIWYNSRIENASYDGNNIEENIKSEIKKLYNSPEYKNYKKIYKKRQDVLKKGSKEAGIDIDIEEATSWDEWEINFDIFKLTDKIKDWKCVNDFYKWLYLKVVNNPDFDQGHWDMYPEELDNITKKLNHYYQHVYSENMFNVAPLHIKDYIYQKSVQLGGTTHDVYVKVKNKFPEVAKDAEKVTIALIKRFYNEFRKTKEYKNCVKTQAVYKKGSEEAGIDIDIEENNEPYSDLNSSYHIFPYFKVVHNWKNKDEFTEWLYKEIDIEPGINIDSKAENWTHAQMVACYIDEHCYLTRDDYYEDTTDEDEVDSLAYEDTLKLLKKYYKKFKIWKKTQDVLKKGSKEAGMEIDIEESNNNNILLKRSNNEHDYGDIYSLVKHWEDGDLFIKWLSERVDNWPSHNKDNPLQEWWDNTVDEFSRLDPNRYNSKKRTVEDNIELALTSIEFSYDEFVNTDHYLKTKATRDVLNKGSKEAGIEIDI